MDWEVRRHNLYQKEQYCLRCKRHIYHTEYYIIQNETTYCISCYTMQVTTFDCDCIKPEPDFSIAAIAVILIACLLLAAMYYYTVA